MKQRLLFNDQYYHVFSRSIAKFIIFNDNDDYLRFLGLLNLYRYIEFNYRYSDFLELSAEIQSSVLSQTRESSKVFVEIVAFCIMPTHVHLILKQKIDHGISLFISKVLNSYTRYFNLKHKRKGPLWETRFKDVLVINDDQLLHLTRYLHLNPTTANLVKKPEDWSYSSYRDYIASPSIQDSFCNYKEIIDMRPKTYQKFTEDQIDYQKKLSKIKNLLIDNYSG